jgi:hypothetical protein
VQDAVKEIEPAASIAEQQRDVRRGQAIAAEAHRAELR